MESIIEIPEKVKVTVDGREVTVISSDVSISRNFPYTKVKIESDEKQVKISYAGENKNAKRMINTFTSHINNMIIGAQREFTYKLKIVFNHFPITLEQQGNVILVKNFLGERKDRKAKIIGDSKVKVEGADVTVTGHNKEHVAQTAANIEQACRVRKFDRRIIQDGVFITYKDRGEMDA